MRMQLPTRVVCAAEPDLTLVPYCDYAPQAALDNPSRFHYLLARDPDTGSFSDYEEQVPAPAKDKYQMYKITE
jgi:hypothetical protein